MKRANKTIGFDRTIKLEWLKTAAELAGQNYSPKEINVELEELLLNQIKGKEARRKTRTVLLAVWAKTRKELLPFRQDAFKLLELPPPDNHIAVHWGMSMAVHPFFGDVANIIGRLLKLQGTASSVDVQRRIKEIYGERETVSRAVQRLFCTFVEWGMLTKTSKQNIYNTGIKIHISEPMLIAWLTEAFLHASDKHSGTISEILTTPTFFPFDLKGITEKELTLSGRLDIMHHGFDENIVMLRENNSSKGKAAY